MTNPEQPRATKQSAQYSDTGFYSAGMTLIEVLIVISIFGILVGLVSINLQNDQRQNLASAEQFAARINHATLLATLRGNAMGLSLSDHGYEFWELNRRYNDSVNNGPQWLLTDQKGLTNHRLRANQQLLLQLDRTNIPLSETPPTGPQLFFPASGELPNFTISLTNTENSHRFLITADASRFLAVITNDSGDLLQPPVSATQP
ncbi:MAG: GspH/FimT family pseudopilin [Immundisolibacteraceae bacterium]|nr:GspH/FimT family pseudopilin [Immundisolibacteraceae bacterium]